MGIYYFTYICSGTFTDKQTVTIIKKVKIASLDQIIEKHEWDRGYVDLEELRGVIKKLDIELVPMTDCDLFLEEVCATTYDGMNDPGSSKYVLVQNGYTYNQLST